MATNLMLLVLAINVVSAINVVPLSMLSQSLILASMLDSSIFELSGAQVSLKVVIIQMILD
jgi:hypothetical protein